MNVAKRIAAIINLVAAVVFIGMGISQGRNGLIALGAVFLLIGILRLRQPPTGSPPG